MFYVAKYQKSPSLKHVCITFNIEFKVKFNRNAPNLNTVYCWEKIFQIIWNSLELFFIQQRKPKQIHNRQAMIIPKHDNITEVQGAVIQSRICIISAFTLVDIDRL